MLLNRVGGILALSIYLESSAPSLLSQTFLIGRTVINPTVIKLFNAILTAHKHTEANDLTIPSASAAKYRDVPIPGIKGFGKKDKDNIMGRGSRQELTKEGFLELVKRGTA